MSTILVLGGGVIGLSMAMMLARQGHSVTVLDIGICRERKHAAATTGAQDDRFRRDGLDSS